MRDCAWNSPLYLLRQHTPSPSSNHYPPPPRTGNLSIFKLSRLSFISTSLPPSCDPLAVVVVIVAVYVVAAAIEIASRLHEQIRGTLFVIEGSQRLIAGKGEGEGDKICDDSFRVLAGL